MSTIVTRAGKGSPLTNNEVDSNFTNLNTDKVETITSADGSVVVSSSGTTRDLSVGIAGSTATLISQVRNETGATLTKGTLVYISGASGNKATVSKARANTDATSAQTYGMVQADIPNSQNGYVVVIGVVSGVNTSAFADGTQLYLSGTTAGEYTSTKPSAPTHLVYVGVVTRSHATQGTIEVKIQNGYEMDEIHDVSAQSPTNGDTLVYNSSTGLWTKTAQSAMSVGSAATLATARNINGVSFNGSADITVADSTKLPLAGGTLTGNLGIGVTPSAWSSAFKVLQLGGGGALISAAAQTELLSNAYYDTSWKYFGTGLSTRYQGISGQHIWSTAATGTAGNAITWTQAMTLDADGDLGIGTSSPATKLDVTAASSIALARFLNTTAPTLSNDTHAGEALFLRSGGTAGSGNVQAVLAFGKADGSSIRSGSAIASVQTTADADQVGIGFYTSTSTSSSQTLTQAMLIDA